VNVFGGEPTEYRHLPELVAGLERRQLRFYFSTNGLCDSRWLAEIVASPALESVTLHVDRRSAYSDAEYRTVIANARLLGSLSFLTVLRHTIADSCEGGWDFLVPFLRAAPRAFLGVALALPSGDGSNQHIALDDLARSSRTILDLARSLAGPLAGVRRAALAKPYPICAFTPDELQTVLSTMELHARCELGRSGYADQVTIGPDGTVSPCMALTGARFQLPAPRPLEELAAEFSRRLSDLVEQPLLARCAACPLHAAGICQAACYAYAR
jgi:radical SAM protein with 4Fe4S-binding SPASM domain